MYVEENNRINLFEMLDKYNLDMQIDMMDHVDSLVKDGKIIMEMDENRENPEFPVYRIAF